MRYQSCSLQEPSGRSLEHLQFRMHLTRANHSKMGRNTIPARGAEASFAAISHSVWVLCPIPQVPGRRRPHPDISRAERATTPARIVSRPKRTVPAPRPLENESNRALHLLSHPLLPAPLLLAHTSQARLAHCPEAAQFHSHKTARPVGGRAPLLPMYLFAPIR